MLSFAVIASALLAAEAARAATVAAEGKVDALYHEAVGPLRSCA